MYRHFDPIQTGHYYFIMGDAWETMSRFSPPTPLEESLFYLALNEKLKHENKRNIEEPNSMDPSGFVRPQWPTSYPT